MRAARLSQIALCTGDMPGTIRRYVEVFGFADAGGDMIWGDWLGTLQDAGDDAACTIWCLCGRQSFLHLELFQHTRPVPRDLAADRRACDVGWSRLGIVVPDFADCVARLRATGVETLTEPLEHEGLRRVCFRDPDFGAIVEVIEEGALGAPQVHEFAVGPTIAYVTLAVADFDAAHGFFADVVGLAELDAESLHTLSMERLWGLEGATRRIAVFDGWGEGVTGCRLELVGYSDPAPAPLPDDARIIDRGISHVAFGYREREDRDRLAERLEADGREFTLPLTGRRSTYLYGPERAPLEIFAFPATHDLNAGFVPRVSTMRPAP